MPTTSAVSAPRPIEGCGRGPPPWSPTRGRQSPWSGAPIPAILVGPAVRGRASLGAVPRAALWFFVRLAPWFPLTAEGMRIRPSDNVAMLRALNRDPLVIKSTRLDALHGLVDLMDAALAAGGRVRAPTLILLGVKDELVPMRPYRQLLRSLPGGGPGRAAVYSGGYHMLLRDLGAARALGDILAWIDDPAAPLPSGADRAAAGFLAAPGSTP